jgi:hypothetical protein
MKTFATFLLGTLLLAAPVTAQEPNVNPADTNMEILLQKVKADKKLLVATNMDLSDTEGTKFWPLYDAYQKDLEKINQQILRTIEEYAKAFNQGKGAISNETAKKLLNEALSTEEAEVKLKRSYADKIGKVLSATKTARCIQIENKIRAIVKADLSQRIPLVY